MVTRPKSPSHGCHLISVTTSSSADFKFGPAAPAELCTIVGTHYYLVAICVQAAHVPPVCSRADTRLARGRSSAPVRSATCLAASIHRRNMNFDDGTA